MLLIQHLRKVILVAVAIGMFGFSSLPIASVAAQPITPTPDKEEGVVEPMAVIGPVDSRVRINPTTQIPNSAVVQILFNVGNSGYLCSGSVIAPQYVLTAGHCVYDDGIYSTGFTVIPGRNAASAPYGTHTATLAYVPPIWITTAANGFSNADLDYDWALLRLNSPVSGAIQPFAITSYSDSALVNIPLFTNAGYPGDICRYDNGAVTYCPSSANSFDPADVIASGDTQWSASGAIIGSWLTTYRIGNQIDTFGGQSGSPLYVVDNNQPTAMRNIVTGVLSYSLTAGGDPCYNTPGALCPPASSGNFFRRVTSEMLEAIVASGATISNPACFQVDLAIGGNGNGTATKSPDRSYGCSLGTYTSGQVISLSAVANAGNILSNWVGATGDVNATMTVSGATTITAVFASQPTPPANTVLQAGIYDERNTNIAFQGGWTVFNGTGPANNTLMYTSAQNAITQFAFNGTGITLFRTTSTNRGPMEVCIDTACQTISNNSSTTQWNVPVTINVGAAATRVVRIRNLSNNPTTYIDLDQVQVIAPPTPLALGSYEETNSNVTYTGTWVNYVGTGPKGGSFKYSNDPNARVSFTVESNAERVIIYRTMYAGYGPVGVYVDGNLVGTMPTSTTLTWGAPYTIILTPNGNTRSIELRNTSSQYIGFEAFDVTLAPPPPTPFALGNYEETHANLTYTGNWINYAGAGPKGGTFKYSNDPNARVSFSVVSTAERVIIYRTMYTGYGPVGVYVDGNLIGTMPTSTALTWGAPYVITLTPNGNARSIELRNTSSQYVGFEAFDVTLAPPPPTPFAVGSYEETNSNLTYTGNWVDYTGTGPKGGTFKYTNDPNARVSFSVVSTAERVIIYRTMYSGYGPVGVYVDGNLVGTMPTSTTLTWGAPYVITLTPNGNARSIELRNTSSQYVGFEAFDVALAPAPLVVGNYEETNANLTYTGNWVDYAGAGPKGGTFKYTNDPNARVSFSVVSTTERVIVYRTLYAGYGPVGVYVDGNLVGTMPTSTTLTWGAPFVISLTPNGNTRNIELRNTSSQYFGFEAFDVAMNPAPLAAGLYQESNTALAYVGSWTSYTGAGPNGGSFVYTSTLNAQVTFQMTGEAFRIYRTKAYNRGTMDVCIDASPCVSVNNYDPGIIWNSPVLFGSLGAGTHTVVIRNTSATTSVFFDMDALEVFATTPTSFALPTTSPTSVPTLVEVTATVVEATPTLIPATAEPTATLESTVTETPTLEPTAQPSPTPLPTETLVPTAAPTDVPTEVPATPEPSPTPLPTDVPTETPAAG